MLNKPQTTKQMWDLHPIQQMPHPLTYSSLDLILGNLVTKPNLVIQHHLVTKLHLVTKPHLVTNLHLVTKDKCTMVLLQVVSWSLQ